MPGRGKTTAGLLVLLVGLLAVVWFNDFDPERHIPLSGGTAGGHTWRVEAWHDASRKTVCADLRLRYYSDARNRWEWSGTSSGTEACTWPKTTDGSGWVRDGGAQEIGSSGEWVFFGVVPDEAATVRLTLEHEGTRQVATFTHRGLAGRFYVIQQRGFHPDGNDGIFQARLVLLDGAGRPLHAY